MSKLRVERYIQALNEEERRQVAAAIESQGRPSLLALWKVCMELSSKGSLLKHSKQQVFMHVFGEAYTKESDYRLRNEYRLLVRTIEQVLATQCAQTKSSRDRLFRDELLLEVLAERQLWHEFDAVFTDALDRARAQYNYQQLFRLQAIAIAATVRKGMLAHDLLLEMIGLIDQAIGTLNDLITTEYERLCAVRASVEHMFDAEKIAYSPPPSLSLERTTVVGQYYQLKRRAVRYSSVQRLEAAQQCVTLIEQLAHQPGTPLFAERISAVGTLAVLLMIVGNDYTTSAKVSYHAIELALQHGDQSIIPLLAYNYCSALMKARAYRDVLEFLDHHAGLFEDARVHVRFALLRTYAYVFLGNLIAAQRSLPVLSRRSPIGEYHYAWYLYAILAYMRGDTDDALREIDNLRKHFIRQKLRFSFATDYKLVGIFHRFFAALAQPSLQRRRHVRQKIEHELHSISNTDPSYRDYLPLIWLTDHLDDLTAKAAA